MSSNTSSTMDIKNITATIIPSYFMGYIKNAIDCAPRNTSISTEVTCDIKVEIDNYDSVIAFTIPMVPFNVKMSYDKYMVCDITLDDERFREDYFNVDNYFEDMYVDEAFDVHIDGYSVIDCVSNVLGKSEGCGCDDDCNDNQAKEDELQGERKILQKAYTIGSNKNAIMETARMNTRINQINNMIPHPLVLKCIETALSFCACVKKDY